MLPLFPRGAVGVGAVLSIMALLMRNDVGTYLASQESASPMRRVTYLILFLLVVKYRETLLGRLQQIVRKVSLRVRKTMKRSALSSHTLKKSFSSAEALCRLSRASSSETMRKLSSTIRNTIKSYRRRAALKAITRKECFVKLDYVGQLSIQDLVILFRYVNGVDQMDFHKKQFMKEQSQLVRSIVTAMDMAVTMSRGGRAQSSKITTTGERQNGEVDALYFAAVTRIFAEWRSLRMVPKGYNRYAVGLNLAYRDVLQNLAKIEDGVHAYFKYHDTHGEDSPCSPTLRQLIEFELKTSVHPRLPILQEQSAASGLLWTKRQLHYQTSIINNLFQVPQTFETTQDGVAAAYTEVYDQYHGWAIKQVFARSFGGSPPVEVILRQMRPDDNFTSTCNTDLPCRQSDVSESGEALDNEFLASLEGFGKEVSRKWNEILRFFNCVDNDDDQYSGAHNIIMSSESYLNMTGFDPSQLAALEECPSTDDSGMCIDSDGDEDPVEDSKAGSLEFVKELRPLIEDIGGLVEEFNMNDPSKV